MKKEVTLTEDEWNDLPVEISKLLYKKWLDTTQSIVFDVFPYTKHTLVSITDKGIIKK